MTLTDFEPGLLKQIIEKHERKSQGLDLFRGSSLEVTNIRILPALVRADIAIRLEQDAQPEMHCDREYHAQFFLMHSTRQTEAFLGIEHLTRDEFYRVFWKDQLVDCFINSEEGLMRQRAERLAHACALIEEEGGRVSYLAVTKKLIELHLRDLNTAEPGLATGTAQDAFAGDMQGH